MLCVLSQGLCPHHSIKSVDKGNSYAKQAGSDVALEEFQDEGCEIFHLLE